MTPKLRRGRLTAAIALAAFSTYLVVGFTVGTSDLSPIAGTWIQATLVAVGSLGLLIATALALTAKRRGSRPPR